ncbi:Aldehyde/histidinol dehydrogenase [Schizothecium vesticola]|uniref:aldehyde dehydrogenase (NAD(+)) n=1 Tax=Schizothecium vesticola TaxID=314040 RepID=A0AA40K5Z2_9PEZI|nr:Aldehyde/histidinol dehydrogenase [Schizothecium vesticola]
MGSLNNNYALDFKLYYNTIDNALSSTNITRRGVNPATEEVLPLVPVSTREDVDDAVRAGQDAFPSWRELSWDKRAEYLVRFADAIEANLGAIAELLGRETGKPVEAAARELEFALSHIRVTAKLRIPEQVLQDNEECSATLRYTPLGVGVGIIPWNFPVLLGLGKLDAALLSGNTFIWKPSPFSPYTALKLGELAARIFPRGVVQVLSGDDDLGPRLTSHPGIAKVSFTGSTATGKKVMQSCAATLKRFTLELGGNDAAIVCDDADLAKVVPKVGTFAFLNSGQVCMDIKRLYVHAAIYDDFMQQLVTFAKGLRTGGGGDSEAFSGPIQNAAQFARVQDLYGEVSRQSLKTAMGGSLRDLDKSLGYFMPLTIIDNPPEDSRVVVEEAFGPILPVLKWTDEKDVIARANNTKMGLGASVWSGDVERAQRIANRLEAGNVWVNNHFHLAPHVPFGGHKWSGIGMDWGVEGLKGWCNPQVMWVTKNSGGRSLL